MQVNILLCNQKMHFKFNKQLPINQLTEKKIFAQLWHKIMHNKVLRKLNIFIFN